MSIVGKGLGWELAEALVNYGLQTLRLPQITATITPDNLNNVPTDLYRLDRD